MVQNLVITADHDDHVIVESPTFHNSTEIIEFVERWKGGDYLMKVFEQANPYISSEGNFAWVLVRVK